MDLYGLPAEEFVAARDAWAKELRAGGERDRAAEVKALPKPTRAAAVVNGLVRTAPEAVGAVVAAGEALAKAQEAALSGSGGDDLRGAMAAAREAIDAAVALVPDGGAVADKVRETLRAATIDPGARQAVGEGRLVKELTPSGLGGLDDAVAPTVKGEGEGAPARSPKSAKAVKGAGTRSRPGAGDTGTSTRREREAAAREAKRAATAARVAKKRRDSYRRAREAEATAAHELGAARRALEQVERTAAARRADVEKAAAKHAEAAARLERAEAELPAPDA